MQKILQFKPIYKKKIWGGRKFETYLKRNPGKGAIGESWEISDYGDDISIIENGEFKGKPFRECYKKYPQEILGDGFGNTENFPLLVKIIDATDKLSIQVHPDDAFTEKYDPKNCGKKEAWYVLQSDQGSEIICGFSKETNRENFKNLIEENNAEQPLQKIQPKAGDAFLINPGTIHGIGGGNLILEIQQSSDSTYRVYDYGRKDNNGSERELHLDKALNVINFRKSDGKERLNAVELPNRKTKLLSQTDKFRMELFETNESCYIPSMYEKNIFQILHVIDGSFEAEELTFRKGDTFLATASGMKEKIKIFPDGKVILMLMGV